MSSNAELPKPANIINDLVNPGELIKQAQKESVLNNTFSNKAEEAKGMNNCSGTLSDQTSKCFTLDLELPDYYSSTLHMTLADQVRWVLCWY